MNQGMDYWSGRDREKKAPTQSRLSAPQPANCLGDQDPMPFGKHKGVEMQFVPPGYLDWLAGQDWIIRWPKVMNYIEWRRGALDQELERKEKS
jgi:hypothetical protein